MNRRDLPIGIFDSGVGGLTVVKEIMRILPHEDIVYLGDTARVPYGNKSPETIIRYADEITHFLAEKNVKIVVVACNTVSSVAINYLSNRYHMPIMGVITPGTKKALRLSSHRRIGVIGTEATISSGSYLRALTSIDPTVEYIGQTCPLFVPIAEEGFADHPATKLIARTYLATLHQSHVDAVILGCTHYPLLKKVIADEFDVNVTLIDSGLETALQVQSILIDLDLTKRSESNGIVEYFVTDNPAKFIKIGSIFLERGIADVQKVDIDKL